MLDSIHLQQWCPTYTGFTVYGLYVYNLLNICVHEYLRQYFFSSHPRRGESIDIEWANKIDSEKVDFRRVWFGNYEAITFLYGVLDFVHLTRCGF